MTPGELVATLLKHGQVLSTAESCTGGMVAAAITDVAGSSAVFDRGFVTYSNAAKTQMLGVPAGLIDAQGAVSEAVARAMAIGALANSAASITVSITGVAGPGGATKTKPIGLVHFACASRNGDVRHERMVFDGDRASVRVAARDHALQMLAMKLAG